MGLLDRFKSNPGRQWKAAGGAALEFDFSRNALCGVGLGDPVSLLWQFGQPEDAELLKQGAYCFYSQGFEVDIGYGKVDGFLIVLNDLGAGLFQPFRGKFLYRGAEIPLHSGAQEPAIVEIFGEPFWRDQDETECVLFYETRAIEWQFEIGRESGLSALTILAPPLLADPQNRRSHGVTRPWPPGRGA